MHEIDSMDMLSYLKIRAWSLKREAKKGKKKKASGPKYIDQFWPMGGQ